MCFSSSKLVDFAKDSKPSLWIWRNSSDHLGVGFAFGANSGERGGMVERGGQAQEITVHFHLI